MKSAEMITKKVFIKTTVIFLTTLFFQLPNLTRAQEIRVGTINLYLGAEIQSLASAPNPPAFIAGVKDALDQVAANDFTERAVALAAMIIEKDLHLIGLQEVYNFTSSIPALNDSPPFLNYLEELLDALSAQGACYYDAATITNLNFGPIPVPTYGWVTATDRDVILARCDVNTAPVDLQSSCMRPSVVPTDDGCTLSAVSWPSTF
jgi:hypothetical protein